jgi:hypothetical protein
VGRIAEVCVNDFEVHWMRQPPTARGMAAKLRPAWSLPWTPQAGEAQSF